MTGTFKLTMISENLNGVKYVSKDFHKNRDNYYETKEKAVEAGENRIKSSKEHHIGNHVAYKIEEVRA